MPVISKVLIANRGEIAVRIIRACADYGVNSVAVYADSDREALHVTLADEAYSLHGTRAADTYLDIEKLLDVAKRSGANAVHPGYGFLAENASFAQAVIDAGLIWIGPSPAAIDALGDKVSARHIAQRAGAPLVPGTPDPVETPDEVHTFAAEHGLPIAIKAAFGGGGRGLKVARTTEEITELYESAVREATAAFGRGECFVERYLDRPRHVETQCLADAHGNVVVVSTRDCSLQRRHQKLVEEAPAPFLTEDQNARLVSASQAILREAGYQGAGTCEFLVGTDGTISFLEVNTRLQVEHPVTEEITGIDLVVEQLRIAEGQELGYTEPTPRGHSIEFRINGEDPAANFLPAPGRITRLSMPSGPGVRVDSGVIEGDVISGAFDSMIAKVIVTGKDRPQAIARARRALAEMTIEGIATVLPFHRAVLDCDAFAPRDPEEAFTVYTSWIESEFLDTCTTLGQPSTAVPSATEEPQQTERVVVEVGGKRLEVVIPVGLGLASRGSRSTPRAGIRRAPRRGASSAPAAGGDHLTSPMQGTIVKLAVEEGATVAQGDLIVVLEAMKMEQPLTAHRAGTITRLQIKAGDPVTTGAVICEITD
ncbi:acetyl/propionyl/methylcrotonyl-CoA carboxylase subunit alpha [Jonesia quinghaiensis]|uniref:acetyl/propionyl/methylcrotonyl-CoA carboxylase subunit alpha n=1 Tax=Jonesia quinghaiensis TaxID=262806 RepID=UPI00048FDB37|nr:biotin carboxylase N-terminal domain-containing protein [Jonesia quinghaiensis]